MGTIIKKDDEITKEESIIIMKYIIRECDKAINENGPTAHVFMPQIKSYVPFAYKSNNRRVASRATALKQRLEREIKRANGDNGAND